MFTKRIDAMLPGSISFFFVATGGEAILVSA